MRKQLISGLLLVLSTVLFAQEATIAAMRGRVEVQKAGGNWIPATVGMVVAQNTVVSTGATSRAR